MNNEIAGWLSLENWVSTPALQGRYSYPMKVRDSLGLPFCSTEHPV